MFDVIRAMMSSELVLLVPNKCGYFVLKLKTLAQTFSAEVFLLRPCLT